MLLSRILHYAAARPNILDEPPAQEPADFVQGHTRTSVLSGVAAAEEPVSAASASRALLTTRALWASIPAAKGTCRRFRCSERDAYMSEEEEHKVATAACMQISCAPP